MAEDYKEEAADLYEAEPTRENRISLRDALATSRGQRNVIVKKRQRREDLNARNVRQNIGDPPSQAKGWIRDAVSRRPARADSAADVAQWIERGFDNSHYWKLLKQDGVTLEPAVAREMQTAKQASERQPATSAEATEYRPVASLPQFGDFIDTLQDAEGNAPTTGAPFKARLFTGRGRAGAQSVYGQGADGPALGSGRYSAIRQDQAEVYGTDVSEVDVELRNPFVLTNDKQIEELTGQSIGYDNSKRVPILRSLRKELEQRGYDGVLVDLPMGDVDASGASNKRLQEIFAHTQVVEFNPPKKRLGGKRPTQKPAAETAPADTTPADSMSEEELADVLLRRMEQPAKSEGAKVAAPPKSRMGKFDPTFAGLTPTGRSVRRRRSWSEN